MIGKLVDLVIHGEFAQLYYHLWLRLKRLDHSHTNLVSVSDGQPYSNSGGPNLERILQALDIRRGGNVLLELGVGKGIACITLAKYFDWVIGVDISHDLISSARLNMQRANISNVKLYCEDARTFTTGLDDVTHVYMFDPFHRSVTSCVLNNLKHSLQRKPRSLTVIYKAPYQHELFVNSGFKHRCDLNFARKQPFQSRFSIYDS